MPSCSVLPSARIPSGKLGLRGEGEALIGLLNFALSPVVPASANAQTNHCVCGRNMAGTILLDGLFTAKPTRRADPSSTLYRSAPQDADYQPDPDMMTNVRDGAGKPHLALTFQLRQVSRFARALMYRDSRA